MKPIPTSFNYPKELPVSARKEDIARAISQHQVVIVSGETGSGKTTQLPKICLELGRGRNRLIGHTQPRRIAARTVAERIAEETGTEVGGLIGFQVRFTDEVSADTAVKVMTDGILLAEIRTDPKLERYDTIIIDEAHERSLNIDFLLGYLARLVPQRPDLKVIITSATIDSARFATHFATTTTDEATGDLIIQPAPIIEVSGRTYPVEIRYRPLAGGDEAEDQVAGICRAVDELSGEKSGDILVFLAGERDIRDTATALADHLKDRFIAAGENPEAAPYDAVEVLPLFARLSAPEQHRIFEPHERRRIILATNVAETSITVPGIRYVIDTGVARISRYSNKTKVQRLPIEPISQASANQRSGRCGRLSDGIAIRLYSAEDFQSRPKYTEPEILRTSLASVVLQMASLQLGKVEDFPFLDAPNHRAVESGVKLLQEIGALRRKGKPSQPYVLTKTGRILAHLPIDPRLGRMLVEAEKRRCVSETLVIVAALAIQDVRERPLEKQEAADTCHERFLDKNSDFLTYLNLWRYLKTRSRDLSHSAFRKMCRREYLHYLRVREWFDMVNQLRQMLAEVGIKSRPLALPNARQINATGIFDETQGEAVAAACVAFGMGAKQDSDSIHQSLLVALLSNLGCYSARTKDYEGARGVHFLIWPGSGLAGRSFEWVMVGELVETSHLFARTVARIRPEWIEAAGAHLLKRSYGEPFWSRRGAVAKVKEKVTLYGLVLVADRDVSLAKVPQKFPAPYLSGHSGGVSAAVLARDMFIKNALVEGDWNTYHQFYKRNEAALKEAINIANGQRNPALVATEDDLYKFYDQRLPAEITSGPHFDNWWKQQRREDEHYLDFTSEVLFPQGKGNPGGFPETWVEGDLTLPIEYKFKPGSGADGVWVQVPLSVLGRLRPESFQWNVPGLRTELVEATIRALPKQWRRLLVPAPQVAQKLLPKILPQAPQAATNLVYQSATKPSAPKAPLPTVKPFFEVFRQAVYETTQVDLSEVNFDQVAENLPPHLRIGFNVIDQDAASVARGKNLPELQLKLRGKTQKAVRQAVKAALANALETPPQTPENQQAQTLREAKNLREWPPELELPKVIESLDAHQMLVRGYPALVSSEGGVNVKILDELPLAQKLHRQALARLLTYQLALPEKRITSRWNGKEAAALALSPYPTTTKLVEAACYSAALSLVDQYAPAQMIRTSNQFETLCQQAKDYYEDAIYQTLQHVAKALEKWKELQKELGTPASLSLLETYADVKDHAATLIYPGFIEKTPAWALPHLARYLEADIYRINKARSDSAKDEKLEWEYRQVEDLYQQALERQPGSAQDETNLIKARWMLEELRVSLFAQILGTAQKVSAKRIANLLNQ